ncbi:hypothetical protein FSP39_006414 [Pinctada imbricata]|uniref:Uncharacterized protein n=1 Tax=Pinctada imbricata TaxID=66713 RepID=A0AA89C6R7_PINIB|nr:hypothetical protein FSP39_006414 [Pinctada imbricata]
MSFIYFHAFKGSSRVWHGYPDIFIDKKVPVSIVIDARDDSKEEDTTVEDDTETGSSFMAPAAKKMKKDSEEAKSSSAGSSFGLCIEMKKKKSGDALLSMSIVDQIIAEAITNAFAQVNANSLLKGLMIPSFGCTQDHIVVFLYDPENDILLQTNLINLFEVPGELSVVAIIEIWMYLNFAVLFKHDIAKKYKFESAKFRESVKDYLCYYEQASYQERLAPSESGYFREVVVPRMFRISDHVEKNDIK